MLRSSVNVVDAAPDDAEALADVWGGPAGSPGPLARQDAAAAVARIAADPDQRLVVARIDGEFAGAVHLARAPLTPVHSDHARRATVITRRGPARWVNSPPGICVMK